MSLTFLVDQLQYAGCALFQAALCQVGSKKRLWAYFLSINFVSREMLYKAIVYGYRIEKILILMIGLNWVDGQMLAWQRRKKIVVNA